MAVAADKYFCARCFDQLFNTRFVMPWITANMVHDDTQTFAFKCIGEWKDLSDVLAINVAIDSLNGFVKRFNAFD